MSKHTEIVESGREKSLDYELIRVLFEDKNPTGDEASALREIRAFMGDRIFSEAIYELTHISIEDSAEAKSICTRIIDHKKSLTIELARDVGLVMSAMDYITNIRNREDQFTCMDKEKHEKLVQSSISDEKTQAFSSALLYASLDKEIERSKRYHVRFSLILADIDRFKQINFEHGHIFGDKALIGVSNIVKKNLRKSDSIYRYGGDEFVIMLPETDELKAKKIALKLKGIMTEVHVDEIKHAITSSIGIVTYDAEKLNNAKNILNAAEAAAFKAKDYGGNTVFVWRDNKMSRIGVNSAKEIISRNAGRMVVKGEPIVEGIVSGVVFRYEDTTTRQLKIYPITDDETEKEYERIKEAILKVEEDLNEIMSLVENKLEKKQLDIFQVHKFILKDKALLDKIEVELKKKKLNSEAIVKTFFEEWESTFHAFETPELRSKASDIADLGTRILRKLVGIQTSILDDLPENSVLFSTRILPTEIVHLKNSNLKAIVTLRGSKYSHAAILAKALEIPFVSMIDKRLESIKNGAGVLVDGYRGRIIINPTTQEIRESLKKNDNRDKAPGADLETSSLKYKGNTIEIHANIESAEDAITAVNHHCDGIGLTRLEYLYILNEAMPTQERLYEQLLRICEHLRNKPVTIRLLDIGGDKLLPYMTETPSTLSKMGTRGIRYLFKHPEMLTDQLMVLLKLSRIFRIKILIPMVSVPEDIKRVRKALLQASFTAHVGSPDRIEIGAMIEVPSAVLYLDRILELVDFISIGSNDLVQYTMAADREETEVSDYYEKGNEVIIKNIEYIARRARESNVECSLCGELAGDLKFTKKLLDSGISNFSVAPYLIPKLKRKIKSLGSA